MVGPAEDNRKALAEICDKYRGRRLDLRSLTSTGEDIPDAQTELDLLVEFLPMSVMEYARIHFPLEELEKLFAREIPLLRTDDIKLEFFHRQLTRRRTLLYAAQGQEES
jgi:predicted nucleotidyltransferase